MQDMQRIGNNNGHAACASCKHQRKKCGEDCILHPYFPAEKSREFQAVHKVFGVSNVVKLVRSVAIEDRQRVADSLIWEASCRQKDPVLGPFGEYIKISDELKLCRTQMLSQNHHHQLVATTNHHHQNQMLLPPPTPPQQGMMYKPATVNGWNNNGNGNGNNGTRGIGSGGGGGVGGGLAYGTHHHENIVDIYNSLNYNGNNNNNNVQGLAKVKKQEKENSVNACSPLVIPQQQPPTQQQQHSVNVAYNQQPYYILGQYGSINGKKMDNTLWENGQ